MQYTSLEHDIRTLYVPEDYIDRLAEYLSEQCLLPGMLPGKNRIRQNSGEHLQIEVPDPSIARGLQFNLLDVWRVDNQTIRYQLRYRPGRRERVRDLWRSAPSPPAFAIMLPVIAVLAFILPEILLMPVFGLAATQRGERPVIRPLAKQLKAIADGAPFEQRKTRPA